MFSCSTTVITSSALFIDLPALVEFGVGVKVTVATTSSEVLWGFLG